MFDWVDQSEALLPRHKGTSRWTKVKHLIAFGWTYSPAALLLGFLGIFGWILFVAQVVILLVKG